MLVLLVSFILGVSRLAEDYVVCLIASRNDFDPINGLVLLERIAYVVGVDRLLYLVFRPE